MTMVSRRSLAVKVTYGGRTFHAGYKVREPDGRCCLEKRVEASVHMFRNPPAWAIAVAALDGIDYVRVRDEESGRNYSANRQTLLDKGIFKPAGKYGCEAQYILPLQYWHCENDVNHVTAPTANISQPKLGSEQAVFPW